MQKSDFLLQLLDPARAKILRLFILNDQLGFTLSDVAKRAQISLPVAKRELKQLEKLGVVRLVESEANTARERKTGSRFFFNAKFRHANALSAFVHELSPEKFDDVERALRGVGKVNAIVLSGIFIGDIERPADLLLVADSVNEKRLEKVLRTFEPKYGREIRYSLFSTPEFRYRMTINDKLVRDTLDYPHRLLMNKTNLI